MSSLKNINPKDYSIEEYTNICQNAIEDNPLNTAFITEDLKNNVKMKEVLDKLPYYVIAESSEIKFKDIPKTFDLTQVYDVYSIPELEVIIDNTKIIESKNDYKVIQTLSAIDIGIAEPNELKHGLVSEGFQDFKNFKLGTLHCYNGFCQDGDNVFYESDYRIKYEEQYIIPILNEYAEFIDYSKNITKDEAFNLLITHNPCLGPIGSGYTTEFDCLDKTQINLDNLKNLENNLEENKEPTEQGISETSALAYIRFNNREINDIAKKYQQENKQDFFKLSFTQQLEVLNKEIKADLEYLNELYWNPTFLFVHSIDKNTFEIKDVTNNYLNSYNQITYQQAEKNIENIQNEAKLSYETKGLGM